MLESDWLEISEHSDRHTTINGEGFTAYIVKFSPTDWQIDFETDNGAGTYGTVESKQDAITYILQKAGVIEESGVSPKQVIIT